MRGRLPWIAAALAAAVLTASPARAEGRARVAVLDLTAPVQAGAPNESPSGGVIAIVETIPPEVSLSTLSTLIARAAVKNGVPSDFLLRLLKRESGLNPLAVSPKGALGIAQFMPGTAAERGLNDPFDPVQAIPKAAELLRDLRQRYGDWALAAAAYNAGPGRVDAWLLGRVELPRETVDYVAHITGVNAPSWTSAYRPAGPAWPLQIASFAAPLPLLSLTSDPIAIRITDRRGASAEAKRSMKPTDGAIAPLSTAQLSAAAGGVLRPAVARSASSPCAALLNPAAQCLNFSRY